MWMVAAAALLACGAWGAPRLLGLVYQVRGGVLLEQALAGLPEAQKAELPCAADPLEQSQARQKAEQAATVLARAAEHVGAPAQASLLMGRAYCWLGDYEQAAQAYGDYTARRPENRAGLLELGLARQRLAWERAGAPDGLLATIEAGEMQRMQALVAQYPDVPLVWLRAQTPREYFAEAGIWALEAGQYHQALIWYERGLWLDVRHVPTWLAVARVYEAEGRSADALLAYREAWEADAPSATLPLASALSRRGNVEDALEVVRTALEQYPQAVERLDWWIYWGQKLADRRDWEKAGEILAQAVAEFPDDPTLCIQQGWVYFQRDGDIQAAQAAFERAIQLASQSGAGYFAMGQLLALQELYAEADPWFEQALRLSPDQQTYYLPRANAARSAGDYALAITLYQQTIQRFPRYSYAYFHLAVAYSMDGQVEQAVQAIEQALALQQPPVSNFYLVAGRIYEMAEQTEQALDAYRQALSLDAKNQEAYDALLRLEGQE
jgi:tetratricopeptide (TPR) repeat protein